MSVRDLTSVPVSEKLAELRALEVIAPRPNSTTRFVPFVQVNEDDWRRVIAVCEAAREMVEVQDDGGFAFVASEDAIDVLDKVRAAVAALDVPASGEGEQ